MKIPHILPFQSTSKCKPVLPLLREEKGHFTEGSFIRFFSSSIVRQSRKQSDQLSKNLSLDYLVHPKNFKTKIIQLRGADTPKERVLWLCMTTTKFHRYHLSRELM